MLRVRLKEAFLSRANGHIDKHLANVEVLLESPVGVGKKGDIIQEIETELEEVAKYHDLVEMMEKYFPE